MKIKITGLFANIILSSAAVLAVLFSLELLTRLAYQDNLNIYLNLSHSGEKTSLLRPSDITGYEFIPRATGEINSFGLLSNEYPFLKGAGVYRVLILGDSILCGRGWMPDMLEKMLNSRGNKQKVEIWNAAVGGFNVRQYADFLRCKGAHFEPDLVLVGFCIHDFEQRNWVVYETADKMRVYDVPFPRVSRVILNRPLFLHSRLYRWLAMRWERKISQKCRESGSIAEQKANGLYYLSLIKDITERRRIKLVGVIFPYLMPLEDYSDDFRAHYRILREVLEQLHMDYLDLHVAFQPFFKNGEYRKYRNDPSDVCHPNVSGHKVASMAVYDYLIDKYLN